MAGKSTSRKPTRRRPEAPVRSSRPNVLDQQGITDVDYKNVALLRQFLSDRGKIRSRRVTGLRPQQQRQVATAIRNAREMALLPFVSGGR
ncbi:30S ribosomal protein S18 [Williamsia sterculiae]|uniref:Small ribosomal subunit protein bS18 n=1 Tax=Williamsia sterculiae TaxID=1344003 RepID=A0A1N7DJJ6_9NOCA|nr:30S ribosomal protein S18 [Williamsia sterculiae]SIR75980.1 SSU ribosomal protein S18P [Williamsia sterculiae]